MASRFDRRDLRLLSIGLVAVGTFRVLTAPQVFRESVFLAGNDPWHFLFWTETVFREGAVETATELRDPLMVLTMAGVSALLGGVDAAPYVLAAFPVVSALITGVCLYVMAVWLTEDRRIALLSVLFLAVLPASAIRTMLGFGDHHAFDYIWLSLTIVALLWMYHEREAGRERLLPAMLVGVLVFVQTYAWIGGLMMALPLGIYLAIDSLVDCRRGRSPLEEHGSLLVGLGVAAALSALAYIPLTDGSFIGPAGTLWVTAGRAQAFLPTAFLVACLFCVGVAEVIYRRDVDARLVAVIGTAVAVVVVAVFVTAFPRYFFRGFGYMTRNAGIAEMKSLLSVSGSFGMMHLGVLHIIAIPGIAWATRRGLRGHRGWLLVAVYAWYFLFLSVFKIRFLGQLSTVLPLLSAVGFVWFASRLGVARERAPDLGALADHAEIGPVLVVLLLVSVVGIIQIPIIAGQLGINDETAETAQWMGEYADEHDLPADQRYVFSRWDRVRVYNYLVSGDSESYAFGRDNYDAFLEAEDPCSWRQRLRDQDVGFIVVLGDEADGIAECYGEPIYERSSTTVFSVD